MKVGRQEGSGWEKQKDQADKAIAQIGDEEFAATLDPEANSIALIMKHLAGNMRSRWTDFLTSAEAPLPEDFEEVLANEAAICAHPLIRTLADPAG